VSENVYFIYVTTPQKKTRYTDKSRAENENLSRAPHLPQLNELHFTPLSLFFCDVENLTYGTSKKFEHVRRDIRNSRGLRS